MKTHPVCTAAIAIAVLIVASFLVFVQFGAGSGDTGSGPRHSVVTTG